MAIPGSPESVRSLRIPLVTEPYNRDDTTSKDARLVNCFAERVKFQGQPTQEYWIYPRPGTAIDSQPPGSAAAGRGLFEWRGDIYAIFGDKLYRNGTAVSGTVNTTGGVYRFSSSLGATPRLQLGNGVAAYNYDTGAGLVQITDPDFPTSFVKGWAYLNGTTYVMTPAARIKGSEINDPTAWDPLNDILAHIEPDRGVALAKQLVYVIAMKEWTTEVFFDAGNTSGSPLGRVEGAKMNYGCLSADSVQEIDGMLLWLGASRQGSPQVLLVDNLKVAVISTRPIDRQLEEVDHSAVFSWTAKIGGHRFYVLTFKNNNLTLVYDIDENLWTRWTGKDGNYLPFVASCTNSNLDTLLQHESDGRLYKLSQNLFTDAGEAFTVDIYTPNFDGGTRQRKHAKLLRVVADQQVSGELLVRVNDHDFSPERWTNFRRVNLGQRNPTLVGCGTFVKRAHHFRYSSTVRMPRIQAVELQVDVGVL